MLLKAIHHILAITTPQICIYNSPFQFHRSRKTQQILQLTIISVWEKSFFFESLEIQSDFDKEASEIKLYPARPIKRYLNEKYLIPGKKQQQFQNLLYRFSKRTLTFVLLPEIPHTILYSSTSFNQKTDR